MAGLLASAIVSDTVMFRSPTATLRDRRMAERMARIAGVDLDELGRDIFSATALETKPANELLFSDFKEFHIAGHDIGIGQITCMDAERVLSLKDQFIEIMEFTAQERGYDMMLLMLTDMLREGTELLVVGDENNIIGQAFNAEVKNHCVFLPGIVSRKKQIVPTLSALWG
jgi:manganese-dependent inorganic pyrophosphatase